MLEFIPETHTFILNGERVPSVTEVLSPLQEESFKAIRPEVLAAAADRGTLVHEITEAIDLGADYEDLLEPQVMPYVEAYQDFLTEHQVEWDGIETPVAFDSQDERLWISYAGIVDRFGMVDGDWAIVDIKTVNSPSIEQKISVAVQLYAYQLAIQKTFALWPPIAKHYALYLTKDGKYRLFDTDDFVAKEDIEPYLIWDYLSTSYGWKSMARKIVSTVKERHRRKK